MEANRNSSHYLSVIENENVVLFGMKWSLVGILIASCVLLAGCDSFLPKETPRYNTVVGERRVPAGNAEMLGQASTEQAAPVPMVNAQVQAAPTPPAPPAPQPAMQMSQYEAPPMQAAPMPAPAPAPMVQQPVAMQPQAAPVAQQEPSMIDQVSGWFTSEPPAAQQQAAAPMQQQQPQAYFPPAPAADTYPQLPPTQPAPMAGTAPQTAAIEAEIAALERELQTSQQQQHVMANEPVYYDVPQQPTMQSAQQYGGQVPAQDQTTQMTSAEPQLPLPPIGQATYPPQQPALQMPMQPTYQAQPDFTQQPLPENAFAAPDPYAAPQAPVIPQNSIEAHRAPTDQYSEAAPESLDVPMAPPVQSTSFSRLPSGLIPPDMSGEYEQGYLPPSRYSNRIRY